MRRLIFAMLVAAPAFAVGCHASTGTTAIDPAGSTGAGIDVTEANFAQLDAAVNERKGKVVVVDFWATWCAPCVKKFPHFVELHKKYKDKGLACVSASLDKEGPKGSYDKAKVLKFLQDQDAGFANFIVADPDADGEKITKRFGLEGGIPFMAVFGKDGKKVWDSEQKKMTDGELAKLIEDELAK